MTAVNERIRAELGSVLDGVVAQAVESGLFESVRRAEESAPDHVLVVAKAKDTPEPVFYRLEAQNGRFAVSWCSPDRYISQSIESDLMWTGDDLDDLIDEELVDQGWDRGRLKPLKHYRNDEMLFIFVSELPIALSEAEERDAKDLARALMAYENAFRELGDMSEDEDELV